MPKLSRLAGLLTAAAMCQAGPALAADATVKPARQCFWAQNVNSFASRDDRIVNVRVGVKDVYQFEMFGSCHDIDWAERIALVSRGGSNICTGLDAEIIAPSSIGPQRCAVRNIRKLTPDEIKALPKGTRP